MIADHDVALFGESREGAVVGLETGPENNGSFFMNEGGGFRLEFDVDIQGAVEEARAGAAGAVFLDGLGGGSFDFRVGNQVEVVVRCAALLFAGDVASR